MQVTLKNPALAQFIEAEVAAGHYPSVEDAIEAAVLQMRDQHVAYELTEDEVRAIQEGDAEIARGEVVDFEAVKTMMREKYGCR